MLILATTEWLLDASVTFLGRGVGESVGRHAPEHIDKKKRGTKRFLFSNERAARDRHVVTALYCLRCVYINM